MRRSIVHALIGVALIAAGVAVSWFERGEIAGQVGGPVISFIGGMVTGSALMIIFAYRPRR